jgi:hypothetical protein
MKKQARKTFSIFKLSRGKFVMVNEIIFVVTESLDGGYEAKATGYSIYTQCDEYNELPAILRDAVRCHFDENELPSLIRIHLVKDEVIAV